MKKLLFVINTLGCGGAERALLNLLGVLGQEKYEISLLVLTGQGELVRDLPTYVTLINQNYNASPVLTAEGRMYLMKAVLQAGVCKGLFLKRFDYLLKNLLRMTKEGRIRVDKLFWRVLAEGAPALEEEYDLAVAYLEGGATYYVADRVKARKKAAFIHIDYLQAGCRRELDLDCYDKMDHIFVVSNEVKDNFLEVYPEHSGKVSVFHNLMDQNHIIRLAEKRKGFEDDFQGIRILTVGRLTFQKRYDVAIEAMALLKKKSPVPVRWYVLGEGELRSSLEHQIRKLGMESDFCLLGVRTNPFPYYRECDLYVHAVGYEGWGIAIQEAKILGKPILATNCCGIREQIVQGVDGRLCQLDPQSICDEILWMIGHPQACKEYGQNARERLLHHSEEFEDFLKLMG